MFGGETAFFLPCRFQLLRAFTVREGNLGKYDFYYSLQIDPQFRSTYKNCQNAPDIKSFFDGLFGVAKGAVVSVRADIQYRWTAGNSIDYLKGDASLVVAAKGSGGAAGQAGNGCYFDQTLVPTFPLLQYGGGGQADQPFDDFVVKFLVASSSTENLNAVQNIVGLFSQVGAEASWSALTSGLASPAGQAFVKTAQTFQDALKAAGALQNQRSVPYVLKSNGGPNDGRVAITVPALFGDNGGTGYMAIYVRRQGSIALADDIPAISLATVFDSQALPNRQCNASSIAAGTCNANNDSMRVSLVKQLKGIDPAFDTPTVNELIIDAASPKRQATKVQRLSLEYP